MAARPARISRNARPADGARVRRDRRPRRVLAIEGLSRRSPKQAVRRAPPRHRNRWWRRPAAQAGLRLRKPRLGDQHREHRARCPAWWAAGWRRPNWRSCCAAVEAGGNSEQRRRAGPARAAPPTPPCRSRRWRRVGPFSSRADAEQAAGGRVSASTRAARCRTSRAGARRNSHVSRSTWALAVMPVSLRMPRDRPAPRSSAGAPRPHAARMSLHALQRRSAPAPRAAPHFGPVVGIAKRTKLRAAAGG